MASKQRADRYPRHIRGGRERARRSGLMAEAIVSADAYFRLQTEVRRLVTQMRDPGMRDDEACAAWVHGLPAESIGLHTDANPVGILHCAALEGRDKTIAAIVKRLFTEDIDAEGDDTIGFTLGTLLLSHGDIRAALRLLTVMETTAMPNSLNSE